MKDLTAMDVITLYAAIISTIALVWNIVNSILDKLPRMKVHIGIHIRLSILEREQLNNVINITAVNKSVYDMYINQPLIILPEKIDGTNSYKMINTYEPVNYPVLIRTREQYTTDYELNDYFVNLLIKCKEPNKKVRIEITETTGKKFKSNKLKISDILIAEKINA